MLIGMILGYGIVAMMSRVILGISSFFITLLLSPISSLVQVRAELDKVKQQNRESDAEMERLRHLNEQYASKLAVLKSVSGDLQLAIQKENFAKQELISAGQQIEWLEAEVERLTSKIDALNSEKLLLQKAKQEEMAMREQEYIRKIEMDRIINIHRLEIEQIKRKQWCMNCLKEAVYYCCWNSSYCSRECQQIHWQSGHKRICQLAQRKNPRI